MNAVLVLVVTVASLAHALPSHGRRSSSILIVGGEPAEKGEIPYQVALLRFGGQWCGGSILNINHVVTAAHCVGGSAKSYKIRAGEHNLEENDGTEQEIQVSEIFIHENYGDGPGTSANDIAILRLAAPFKFNDVVKPISLPKAGHVSTGIMQTSGWGALYYFGPAPDVLYKVRVPLVDDQACADSYAAGTGYTVDGKIMICAGYLENGGKDSCSGDSGGPLTAYDDGEYLAGIVSWGEGCAEPKYPGVYTEVLPYLDWIKAIIE